MTRRQAQELWTKPEPELKYLNADNVARYRSRVAEAFDAFDAFEQRAK